MPPGDGDAWCHQAYPTGDGIMQKPQASGSGFHGSSHLLGEQQQRTSFFVPLELTGCLLGMESGRRDYERSARFKVGFSCSVGGR